MKKIILSFLLSFLVLGITMAQPPERPAGPRGKGPKPSKENVEALKVAFITRHLNLTIEEAQKFWPAYNAYFEDLKKVRKDNKEDVLAFEEAALNIKKKYKTKAKVFVIKVLQEDNDPIDIPRLINDIKFCRRKYGIRIFNMSLVIPNAKKYNEL